jgi:hypothetical protein
MVTEFCGLETKPAQTWWCVQVVTCKRHGRNLTHVTSIF